MDIPVSLADDRGVSGPGTRASFRKIGAFYRRANRVKDFVPKIKLDESYGSKTCIPFPQQSTAL